MSAGASAAEGGGDAGPSSLRWSAGSRIMADRGAAGLAWPSAIALAAAMQVGWIMVDGLLELHLGVCPGRPRPGDLDGSAARGNAIAGTHSARRSMWLLGAWVHFVGSGLFVAEAFRARGTCTGARAGAPSGAAASCRQSPGRRASVAAGLGRAGRLRGAQSALVDGLGLVRTGAATSSPPCFAACRWSVILTAVICIVVAIAHRARGRGSRDPDQRLDRTIALDRCSSGCSVALCVPLTPGFGWAYARPRFLLDDLRWCRRLRFLAGRRYGGWLAARLVAAGALASVVATVPAAISGGARPSATAARRDGDRRRRRRQP